MCKSGCQCKQSVGAVGLEEQYRHKLAIVDIVRRYVNEENDVDVLIKIGRDIQSYVRGKKTWEK